MRRQFTLHTICINFQVVFSADNFQECADLNVFHEEIFKLHFLLNQGRSIFFKRNSFIREDAALFCYFVVQFVSRNTQSDSFLKELAFAKTAKYS